MFKVVKRLPSSRWIAHSGILAIAIAASSQGTSAGVQSLPEKSDSKDAWLLTDASRAPLNAVGESIDQRFVPSKKVDAQVAVPPADPGTDAAVLVRQELQDAPPAVVIPRLHSDPTVDDAAISKESARAIPLPPAIQSGLTGIVALGMAGVLKRVRRAFR